MTSQEFQVTGT